IVSTISALGRRARAAPWPAAKGVGSRGNRLDDCRPWTTGQGRSLARGERCRVSRKSSRRFPPMADVPGPSWFVVVSMRSLETTSWHCASWQAKAAQQQPVYDDPASLQRVVADLSRLPPIVVSWEVEALRERLAAAQRGQAFLLQGGDCAEIFAECESDQIAKKLKILLQMSLVLLHGLKKPIIRVGRMAGQYAKPRSADMETRNGVTLPSYRGDLVNRPEFTAEARAADPDLLLRGYERAALTLNFARALVDGGFADLHHPEYWDLGFIKHAPLKDAYQRIIQSIGDALDFFEGMSGSAVHEATLVDFYASHEGLHLLYEQAQTRF